MEEPADPVGAVFVRTIARFADQMAQSAAQITAFSSMMQNFEAMRAAFPQSQSTKPALVRLQYQPSGPVLHVSAGAVPFKILLPSAPASIV